MPATSDETPYLEPGMMDGWSGDAGEIEMMMSATREWRRLQDGANSSWYDIGTAIQMLGAKYLKRGPDD